MPTGLRIPLTPNSLPPIPGPRGVNGRDNGGVFVSTGVGVAESLVRRGRLISEDSSAVSVFGWDLYSVETEVEVEALGDVVGDVEWVENSSGSDDQYER